MNKLFHVLNIVFFTFGVTLFIFGSPVVVRASSDIPFKDIGPVSFSAVLTPDWASNFGYHGSFFYGSNFYSAYYHSSYQPFPTVAPQRVQHSYQMIAFSLVGYPQVTQEGFNAGNSSSYFYIKDGVTYTVYYTVYYCGFEEGLNVSQNGETAVTRYDVNIQGCQLLNSFNDDETSRRNVCNYFLFGDGDLDYDLPAQDIEDADLDIKGLSAYILNDFQPTIDWTETINNAIQHFNEWAIKNITGLSFYETKNPVNIVNPITLAGTVEYVVPGVALSWFSPSLDNDIVYNIWIDGKSDINYKTSIDSFVNFLNQQKVSTVSYGKLKINDSSLTQNPCVYYQYNTAQATEFLLDYIENNSSFCLPDRVDKYNYVSLETKISRVYIQASKEIDGENHVGALSYVDIIGGVPVIHEGITSIDDVPASDPSSGTPAIVGSTSVVSGDTIYGGDTYFDNSITNFITPGLVVGNGDPLSALASIKKLFSAIFELVQALYLTKLLKWLLVGFTGNPLGDLFL